MRQERRHSPDRGDVVLGAIVCGSRISGAVTATAAERSEVQDSAFAVVNTGWWQNAASPRGQRRRRRSPNNPKDPRITAPGSGTAVPAKAISPIKVLAPPALVVVTLT